MATKSVRPSRRKVRHNVSYDLLNRFTELLICGRCFSHRVRKPVRQVMSRHHKPLALCHDCSREVSSEQHARILRFN